MRLRNASRYLSVLTALLPAALPAWLHAQEVAYWNTQALPGPLTTSVTAFGPQITIRTSSVAMMYSGILHSWTTVPLTPTTSVFDQYNDHVILRDGGLIQSWSPRTGQIATLNVSPGATLLTGVAGRTWVAAVLDGTTVWGYAAFLNTWVPLTVASPTPTITLNKVTLVVEDGTNVHALSGYYGSWTNSPAATLRSVQENLALTVDGTDTVRAYSAYTNQWSSTVFANAQTATVANFGNTWSLLFDGTNVLGYSAARDSFATHACLGAPQLVTQGQSLEAVAFYDGTNVVAYSPATASFATLPVSGTPTLRPGDNRFGCFVLVVDGSTVTGYSGVHGSFSAPITGTYALQVSDACALALSPTANYAYSAITNAFHAAPATPIATPTVLYNGAVLTHAGSMSGFAARYGTWVTLPAAPGSLETHGSLLVSRSGTHADVWDSRLGRWTAIDAAAPLQPFSCWRLMTVTHDGSTAWGFSQFAGVPDSTPILGNLVEYRANSEIGYVLTNTHIHVFSGTGWLSARYRFPEHSRETRLGVPIWLAQTATPGSVVGTFLGLQPDFAAVPGLGTAFIDINTVFDFRITGVVPASGVLDFGIATPPDTALLGVHVHVQNLIGPPVAPAWITNSSSAVLL